MAKFHYKYESIEEIKEHIKKNSEKEYALSLKAIENKKNEIKVLHQEYNNSYDMNTKLTTQEIIFLEKYRENLMAAIDKKKNELKELEKKSVEKLKVLVEHHKEHKVFEKLKEKELENFIKDQNKLEAKTLDEIANQNFNRREK